MRRYLCSVGTAGALSLAFLSPALAAPVSSADLSGKKICWDNGSVSSYGQDGKYANNMTGEGTWALAAGGVHIHTERYDYVAAMQKSPDGTIHAEVAAANIKTIGKYCK